MPDPDIQLFATGFIAGGIITCLLIHSIHRWNERRA